MKHVLTTMILFICMSILISSCDKTIGNEELKKGTGVVVTAANGEQITLPPNNEIWCKYPEWYMRGREKEELYLHFTDDYQSSDDAHGYDGYRAAKAIVLTETNEIVWRVLDNWRYKKTWPTILEPIYEMSLQQQKDSWITRAQQIALPDIIQEIRLEFRFSDVEEVYMGNNVTKVSSYMFDGCDNLKKVYLSTRLTEIADYMFFDCESLEEITIPKSVSIIGERAFANCPIKNIVIPEKVDTIGEAAFSCLPISKIELPKNLKFLGGSAFDGCDNLKEIYCPCELIENLSEFMSNMHDGVNHVIDLYVPNNLYDEYLEIEMEHQMEHQWLPFPQRFNIHKYDF